MHGLYYSLLTISVKGRDEYWVPLPDNESPDRYATELEDFLRIVLRTLPGHPSGYVIPLSDKQREAGLRLLRALTSSQAIYNQELHYFLYPLLVAQPRQTNPRIWDCPFQNWLAVRGLRDDGNFLTPEQTTGIFARAKYFIRSSAIIEADERHQDHPQGMIG